MLLLGVTTSSPVSGIALWEDGGLLDRDIFPGARSCVEELVPRIEKMIQRRNIGLKDLDRFAVDAGPGGLTGIKIGLVAVRTLAQVLEKPVAPVSSLAALSMGAPGDAELALAVAPCTRNDFFAALYRRVPGGVECVEKDALHTPETLAALLEGVRGGLVVTGPAQDRVRDVAASVPGLEAGYAGADYENVDAGVICELGAVAQALHFLQVQPSYLCLTNAERNFGIRA